MAGRDFDDATQWYWAVASERTDERFERADKRLVVTAGQRQLWARVRAEIDPNERCSWLPIGTKDGNATLEDCVTVLINAREQYGASYNRIMLELAQIPSFARYIFESTRKNNICSMVSNPLSDVPLLREPYDENMTEALGRRVEITLKLESDDWRR